MKKILLISALTAFSLAFAQEFNYGVTGNFHRGSIVNVHDRSVGKYGGGLGFFGEIPLVENDVFDSAWLYLHGQVEYNTQGENAEANPDRYGKQKYIMDYAAMQVYLKYFFHKGNMKRDVFLFAGPRVEFLVREKKETSALYEQAHAHINLDEKVANFGYGLSLGAGLKISPQVEAFLRFDRGFSKVYPDNPRNTYNRMLAVGVNYYLNNNWY